MRSFCYLAITIAVATSAFAQTELENWPLRFEAAVGSESPVQYERGAGVIRGLVLRGDAPAAGVTVSIYPKRRYRSLKGSLLDRVHTLIDRDRERQARSRTTLTNEQGEFAFDDLVEDDLYAIFAEDKQSGTRFIRDSVDPIEPGAKVVLKEHFMFNAASKINVPVSVTKNGEAVDSATLLWSGPDRVGSSIIQTLEWRAGEEIQVASGTQRIWAVKDAFKSKPLMIRVAPGMEPVELKLETETTLIAWDPGAGDHNFEFSLVDADSDLRPGDRSPRGIALENDYYAHMASGLQAGEYLLVATDSDRVISARRCIVEPGFNVIRADAGAWAIEADDVLECVVEVPEGFESHRLSFSTKTVHERKPHWTNGGLATVLRSEGDRYWLDFDLPARKVLFGGIPGTVTLTVMCDQLGALEQEISSANGQVRFEFGPPATIDLKVRGYLGSGREGLLFVQLLSTGSATGKFVSPDWQGEFATVPMLVGDTEVRLMYRGEELPYPLTRHQVNLQPGARIVELNIPPLYSLQVDFPQPQEGRGVRLVGPIAGTVVAQRTEWSGRELFGGLPAGDYTVELTRDGEAIERMQISLRGDLQVVFSSGG